jgi:hypothetical protein
MVQDVARRACQVRKVPKGEMRSRI